MLHSYPLEDVRRFYAEEIRLVAGIRNDRLADAFAHVPREAFLGPGPWQLSGLDLGTGVSPGYRPTPDADPRHVYHNVAITIDQQRNLNNGQPAALATWFDALDLRAGASVYHLGCGTGYYTAIIAETVGPGGKVLAAEVEPELAERARRNLAPWPNVEVVSGDGAALDCGARDAIFINAGITHPDPRCLDALTPGGTLVVPLTVAMGPTNLGKGLAVRIRREPEGFSARPVSFAMIYSCTTGRDVSLNADLGKALSSMTLLKAQSLRRDAHDRAETCLFHGVGFCFSAEPLRHAAAG